MATFSAVSDNIGTISQFAMRKTIHVDSSVDGILTGFQVGNDDDLLRISYESEMRADFSDMRFTEEDGTFIPYYIALKTNSVFADIRFRTDVPAAGGKNVYMYYGNSLLSAGSDGDATFLFFDDFGEGITNPWNRYSGNPIFSKNTVIANAWDSVFVNSPYIAINSDGTPYKDGDNKYYMYYSGGGYVNGVSVDKDQVGLALSTDLYNWTRMPSLGTPGDYNEGLTLPLGAGGTWDDEDTQIGTIIVHGSTFHMWYTGNQSVPDNTHIGYASSNDGKTWTKHASNPVIVNGTGDDNDDLYAPSVILDGSTWKMWYIGQRTAGSPDFGIMYATAPVDEPWNWTKYSINYVYKYDTTKNMWGPYVYKESGTYYMIFANYDAKPYEIHYASSADGISWTYQGKIFDVGESGQWDEEGLIWASQIYVGGIWYTFYRGNNDAFTEIQIGVTTSSNRLPTPAPTYSIDTSKWTNEGAVGLTFKDGHVEIANFGSAPFKGLLSHINYGNFDDFVFETRARTVGAATYDEICVLPRMTDITASQDSYYFSWYTDYNRVLARTVNGAWTSLDSELAGDHNWAIMKGELSGNSLKMYRNNVLRLSATDASHSTGRIGLGGGGSGRTGQYDWVLVRQYTANPPTTSVGPPEIPPVEQVYGRSFRRSSGASVSGGTSCGMGKRRR